jgi:glycyl-tRNA synthetase beta subunit
MINLLIELRTEDITCNEVKNIEKLIVDLKNNLTKIFIFKNTNIYITHRRFTFIAFNTHLNKSLQYTNVATFTYEKNTKDNILKILTNAKTHKELNNFMICVNNKCTSLIYKYNNNQDLLYDNILKTIVESLKNYKTNNKMTWDTNFCSFNRPITQVVVKLNKNCTYKKVFTLKCTDKTDKNRILDINSKLQICARSYVKKLENSGLIIPSYNKRLELLRRKLLLVARKNNMLIVNGKKTILESNMQTEYPNIGIGHFNTIYLKLPLQLLEINIQNDQRCFILEKNTLLTLNISNFYLYTTNLLHNKQVNVEISNTQNLEAKLQDTRYLLKHKSKEPEKWLHSTKKYIVNTFTGTLKEQTKRILILLIFLLHNNNISINKNKIYIATKILLLGYITPLVNEYPNHFNISSGYIFKNYYGNLYAKFCKIYKTLNTETTTFKTCFTTLCIDTIHSIDIICCYFLNTTNINIINKDPLGMRVYIRNYSVAMLNLNLSITKTINTIFSTYIKKVDLKNTISNIIYVCIKKKEQEYFKKINISRATLIFKVIENMLKRICNLIRKSNYTVFKKTINTKQPNTREIYLISNINLFRKKIFLHLKIKNYRTVVTNMVYNLKYTEYFLNTYNVVNKTEELEKHKRVIVLKNNVELLYIVTT